MSPLSLRRYRADRLLRAEFERLRAAVLGAVAARLRAVGVRLDASDLDGCYAQAWQGLYASVLDGREIASAEAWLVHVTYRRAIDEHRARGRLKRLAPGRERTADAATADRRRASHASLASHAALVGAATAVHADLAEQLDERVRLRHVFEALRARLSVREQQAATLCYLQGLSRAEAAVRMGVSERRMHKLMDGRGDGAPGVAQKVGALIETIDAGRWCEEQGSLMRGFAYGILDPAGERYRLAEAHRSECPACRAYVRSLRGLAVVLPPAPSLLHLLLGSGVLAGGGAAAAGTGAAGGSGLASGAGAGNAASVARAGGAGPLAPAGTSIGALSASGAAGAAGGSWWLAGSFGAKLVAGCLLALGVGAGCVALEAGIERAREPAHVRHARPTSAERRSRDAAPTAAQAFAAVARAAAAHTTPAPPPSAAAVAPARQAAREFGPEHPAASTAGAAQLGAPSPPAAHAASAAQSHVSTFGSTTSSTPNAASPGGVSAAQREFAPG